MLWGNSDNCSCQAPEVYPSIYLYIPVYIYIYIYIYICTDYIHVYTSMPTSRISRLWQT